jgi:hypothetical protein
MDEVAVGLDTDIVPQHILALPGALPQRRRQFDFQSFAGHVQHVVPGLAGCRFQIHAGPAVNEKDVASFVYDNARGRKPVEERALNLHRYVRIFNARCQDLRRRGLVAGRPLRRDLRQRPQHRDAFFPAKQFPAFLDRLEQIRKRAHCLRRSQKHQTGGLERVVEDRQELLLQVGIQIDEQISAREQIQLGEWRVLDHILRCEKRSSREAPCGCDRSHLRGRNNGRVFSARRLRRSHRDKCRSALSQSLRNPDRCRRSEPEDAGRPCPWLPEA